MSTPAVIRAGVLINRDARPVHDGGTMSSLPIDDSQAALYTVGQVSAMLSVQQAFLRRLDEHEVVSPRRSPGGQRRYSRQEITLVQYVVRLTDEGMTLAAIRRILELENALRAAHRRIAALEAELAGDGQASRRRSTR
jgi:MerR family transcriptional regulator, heat shock protein HspR